MPGYLTVAASNALLDSLLGGRPVAPAPLLHLGLSRGGANLLGFVDEPSCPDYSRAPLANDPAHFPDSYSGIKENARRIVFPLPRSDWGVVRSVFVADAPEGGTVLAMADLEGGARWLGRGDAPPTIAPGALRLRMA